MIRLGIAGVCGRMGRRIFDLASKDKNFEIKLALERKGIPQIGKDVGKIKISSNPDGIFLVDVFIDFTAADATLENLDYLVRYKKAAVIGTTGLTPAQIRRIEEAAGKIAIVFSPNMSVGVNILFSIIPEIARKLGPDYGIEISEAHHKAKKDAPSGTAKRLGQIIADTTGKAVPIHAVRLGDIIGDHTIVFCGNSERIEITHRAHSRDLFAIGALKAAKWVLNKPAGFYSMQDVPPSPLE